MKTLAITAMLAFAVLVQQPAAAKDLWTQINDTAPRSVFDDIRSSAPRSLFDSIADSAPLANDTADDRFVGE